MSLNKFRHALIASLLAVALAVPLFTHAASAPGQCRCSASLSYAKPVLQFRGDSLVFIPAVNVRIRSRGSERTPWTANVSVVGETSYFSEDTSVPSGASFSQSRDIYKGACGDNISFSGWQLDPVVLNGLNQNLSDGEKIDGVVKMETVLSACDNDSEYRQFRFSLREFGRLLVRGWSSVRN